MVTISQAPQVMVYLTKTTMKKWYLKVHLFIHCPINVAGILLLRKTDASKAHYFLDSTGL